MEQVDIIRIPRCVSSEPHAKELTYELEGFGDASTSGYAAVVCVVVKPQTDTQVQLIASKTRVAPLKKQTTPGLELLGCINLSEVDFNSQVDSGTVPHCQLHPLLDRIEERSVFDQEEG